MTAVRVFLGFGAVFQWCFSLYNTILSPIPHKQVKLFLLVKMDYFSITTNGLEKTFDRTLRNTETKWHQHLSNLFLLLLMVLLSPFLTLHSFLFFLFSMKSLKFAKFHKQHYEWNQFMGVFGVVWMDWCSCLVGLIVTHSHSHKLQITHNTVSLRGVHLQLLSKSNMFEMWTLTQWFFNFTFLRLFFC